MRPPSPDVEILRTISREVERLRKRLNIAEKRIAVLELESAQRRLAKVGSPARKKGADPT